MLDNINDFEPVVKIKLNNRVYVKFDNISIAESMNQLYATCSFRLAAVLNDDTDTIDNMIFRGDKIVVTVHKNAGVADGVVVFSGRVYGISDNLTGSTTVQAATALKKLAKCNYYIDGKTDSRNFIQTWAVNLIKILSASYGVEIVSEYKKHQLKIIKDYNVSYEEGFTKPQPREYASNVRLTLFTVKATETVEAAIRRICDKIGLIPLDDRKGGLMLVDKYYLQTETVLQYGKNVVGGSYSTDDSEMHSLYHMLSRSAVETGKKASQERTYIVKDVESANVEEFKAKTIIVDALDGDECLMSGVAQAKRDVINGLQIQCTVPKWWTDESVIWSSNMVVPVDIARWRVKGQYLIVGTQLNWGVQTGFVAQLDIKPDTVLAYDDPATYENNQIEDEDVKGYLEKQKLKKKKKKGRGKMVPLTKADIAAMTVKEVGLSGGFKYVDGN